MSSLIRGRRHGLYIAEIIGWEGIFQALVVVLLQQQARARVQAQHQLAVQHQQQLAPVLVQRLLDKL